MAEIPKKGRFITIATAEIELITASVYHHDNSLTFKDKDF